MGFGPPGSASLVITDGYGIGTVADTLGGRIRRRRRRWDSALAEAEIATAAVVAKERAMVAEMLLAAELDQLIDERKILRGALDSAAKRQAKAIDGMIERISNRIDDIIEDDEITALLI